MVLGLGLHLGHGHFHATAFDDDASCVGVGADRDIQVVIGNDNMRVMRFMSQPGYSISKLRCMDPPTPEIPGTKGPEPESGFPRCSDEAVRAAWRCKKADFSDPGMYFSYWSEVLQGLRARCNTGPIKGLFLGLGGGTMQSYLQEKCLHVPDLTTVETNNDVLKVAEDFFAFRPTVTNRVVIGDGFRELAEFVRDGKRYDFVVIDTLPISAPKGSIDDALTGLNSGGDVYLNWSRSGLKRLRPLLQEFLKRRAHRAKSRP